MPSSAFSMLLGSAEVSLFRQSRFWMAQLGGWLLVGSFYFRENIESGLQMERVAWTIAATATGWAMAVACSSALAAAYIRLPPQWLTGVRTIPIALGLSLLAALPWATVMTLLDAHAMITEWRQHGPSVFFHTSLLMAAWSVVFLWVMRSERAQKAQARVPTQDSTPSPAPERVAVRWSPDHRVCLQEGKRVRFCLVREIAYIRAADNYTEVHLCNGEVAMVKERLRHWEARLPKSFVRIHRSTMINMELSEELVHSDGAWRFRLRGCPEPLTVSRRLEQAVIAKVTRQKDSLST